MRPKMRTELEIDQLLVDVAQILYPPKSAYLRWLITSDFGVCRSKERGGYLFLQTAEPFQPHTNTNRGNMQMLYLLTKLVCQGVSMQLIDDSINNLVNLHCVLVEDRLTLLQLFKDSV